MKDRLKLVGTVLLFLSISNTFSQEKTDPKNQAEELGTISWYRNYDQAIEAAHLQKKSVLILFQEIPGCATCRNYGHNVLSNPLLTEAIEELFIPLAIHNNKGGKDQEILQKFKEPAWNNPVVRIVNEEGKDMVDRLVGNYSVSGLYDAMIVALKAENKGVSEYVKLLGMELAAERSKTINENYFKMHCFWTGQQHLGRLDGVLLTQPGFMNGNEVVKVKYDEAIISEQELNVYASKASCTAVSKDKSYRVANKDEHFYLKQTNYKYLPLSELQKTKINSALGAEKSGTKYLSPKQLVWLKQLDNPNIKRVIIYDLAIADGWKMKE